MNSLNGEKDEEIKELTYKINIPLKNWEYYLVLSYFDEIKGPTVIFVYPDITENVNEITENILFLMDWFGEQTEYAILTTDLGATYNMFFTVKQEGKRDQNATMMISLVVMDMPVSALGLFLLAEAPMVSLKNALKQKLEKTTKLEGIDFRSVHPHIITAWETFQLLFGP